MNGGVGRNRQSLQDYHPESWFTDPIVYRVLVRVPLCRIAFFYCAVLPSSTLTDAHNKSDAAAAYASTGVSGTPCDSAIALYLAIVYVQYVYRPRVYTSSADTLLFVVFIVLERLANTLLMIAYLFEQHSSHVYLPRREEAARRQ